MDSRTGDLYPSRAEAVAAGVPELDIVDVRGTPQAVRRIAGRVRQVARGLAKKRAAKRRIQKASRARNRH